MKCSTALSALSALVVLSVCCSAAVPGTAAGLPRMRDSRPANLPAQRHHPARKYRKNSSLSSSSSSSSHHHRHRHHRRDHHRRRHARRSPSRKHRKHHGGGRPRHISPRAAKRSSAHKSLKRFAVSHKPPHKTPKGASAKSLYVLIKGRYSWPEAAHTCWKHGYELASLDARNTGRLVKQLRRGHDGVRKKDAAYWLGSYEKKRKVPLVLRVMDKRRPSIHRLNSALDIRIPVLCQVRHPAKLKDPFRYNDRRHYCDAPKTICVIGRKGPECQDGHCPLGVDKLYRGRQDRKMGKEGKGSSCSSYSSSSRSSSAKHTSLFSSASSASKSSHSSSYGSHSSSSSGSTSSPLII